MNGRYQETIAGASAGIVGTVLGYPLDVIKTRQQVSRSTIAGGVRAIFSEGGVYGFYKGMASPLLSLTILNTLNFSTYAKTRSWLEIPRDLNAAVSGFDARVPVAGAVVGPLSSLISTPFELIKTQMQLSARNAAIAEANGGSKPAFKGSLQAAQHIFRHYGLSALYRGYAVNTTREMVFLGTYFSVYEHVKSMQQHSSGLNLSPSIAVPLAGGLAGAVGWLISFPLDCIKSNIQGVDLTLHRQTRVQTIVVARELVRKSGFIGLYAGVIPSILRAFLVSSSRFSAYEATLWLLNNPKQQR